MIRIRDIIHATESLSGYAEAEIIGPQRTSNLVHWRQCAMYVARKITGQSLPQIGRIFRRDHSTVLYACRAIARDAETLHRDRIEAITQLATHTASLRVASYFKDAA